MTALGYTNGAVICAADGRLSADAADLDYVAALSPDVVLALIAELRAARDEVSARNRELDGAYKRIAALEEIERRRIEDLSDMHAAIAERFHIRLTSKDGRGYDERGIHSGRRRWQVNCTRCGSELHEATTGPFAWHERHKCETR